MKIRFDGQIAIISGAGRGLGRAYALELAARGATVVVNDRGVSLDGARLESDALASDVVAEISARGGRAIPDHADIRSADDVGTMVNRTVEQFGRVDIAICNAGNMRKLRFSETEETDLASHLATHVMGTFLLAKAVWPYMINQHYGRIIMTTSQVGLYGQIDAAAYGSAKMAIIGLMHGMKLEAANTGILVNCISPSAVTRMASGTFSEKLTRFIDPACVAPAVAYLASCECALRGQVLIAGGGHFAIAETIESNGIDIANPSLVSAERLRDEIAVISNTVECQRYSDALSAVQKTFDRLLKE
jgi:NAD(P)-dependent dehydrogenase (short-subunit alcohol dehydrogenase family)